MKKVIVLLSALLTLCFLSFQSNDVPLIKVPKGWPKPNYDFKKNLPTEKKIQLGRILFYDPILSRDSTISCSSCHSQYNAFAHVDHQLSHGIDGKIGTRNAPALINLAWGKSFMWDGAVNHLDMQALAPITNALEMDENIKVVTQKLQRTRLYPKLFYDGFGDSIISGEYVLKSISQFMLTLVSANAKYDKVTRGEEKFTQMEQNGYYLFQKNCNACHTEPLFTNSKFENNGIGSDTTLNDFGRMKITNRKEDSLKFKVPTLRNIEFSYPYMHDGRFKNLNAVLNHYSKGIPPDAMVSPSLKSKITLSPNEKVDLIAFLLTLTDKEFLFNPNFSYPH